ncbi:PIG-L deacetylase family protein [Saccharothrix deserti]|uniref:PIG-L deacetylase family protein n=1 Tax=Saccharothrix deserti TaxID=2593674 RepID=UPI00131BCB78|nr:PIG-L deacetylase family protein [Saccharothrix deserti]
MNQQHPFRSQTVVAVSPHSDDAEYGVGSLLAAYAACGHRVTIVLMTGSDETRLTEAKSAAAILGADLVADPTGRDGGLDVTPARVRWLEEQIATADMVFAPHPDDTHQDHRAVTAITSAALRRSTVGLSWYRTPSSGHAFTPTAFSPVTEYSANVRQRAIEMHRTQADRAYLRPEHLALKDAWFGWLSGHAAAEPLQVVRHQLSVLPGLVDAC